MPDSIDRLLCDPLPLCSDLPCPCGRERKHRDCCLPLIRRLRQGPACSSRDRGSPFHDLRAAGALRLWFPHDEAGGDGSSPLRPWLAAAARLLWGTAPSLVEPDGDGAARTHRAGPKELPGPPSVDPREATYAAAVFERTWAPAGHRVLEWLSGLPTPLRRDPVLAELVLDWLLWDADWLRRRPLMAHVLEAEAGDPAGPGTASSLVRGLLESRLSPLAVEGHEPGQRLLLRDLITDEVLPIDTPTEPWPRAADHHVMLRPWRIDRWIIAAGEGVVVPSGLAEALAAALRDARMDAKTATLPILLRMLAAAHRERPVPDPTSNLSANGSPPRPSPGTDSDLDASTAGDERPGGDASRLDLGMLAPISDRIH